jgi:hypothetical protein
MKESHRFRIGDVVKVKPNVSDPDLGIGIGDWQGRISEISPKDNTICIDWDSMTLDNIPSSVITQCEEKGLDWTLMYLGTDDVESATARDTEADVARVVNRLQAEHAWDGLGDEGRDIGKVLAGVHPEDEWEAFEAWDAHLREVLEFPFRAKIAEPQERGPLRAGDEVVVRENVGLDDPYGVLVAVEHDRHTHHFPLCDLEAADRRSANYRFLRAYVVWFANH